MSVVLIGAVLAVVGAVIYFATRSTDKNVIRDKDGKKVFGMWRETKAGLVLRSAERPEELLAHPEGVTTMAESWARSVREYASQPCLGVRDLISVETHKDGAGRLTEKLTLGDYKWSTYEQIGRRVESFGAGLAVLGHQRGERVAIFAETSTFWQMSAQAAFSRNFPLATVYPSLGAEAANYAISEAECSTVVVDAKLLKTIRSALPACVKRVVYIGKLAPEEVDPKLNAHAWEEVEKIGADKPSAAKPPTPSDICVVMYTSGSTGTPKGVLISHGNLLSVQAAVHQFVQDGDSFLAYLPLAHVLELAAETAFLGFGLRIGYGSPLTLTDNSPKIQHGTKGDATALRPSLMAAVPAIMDRIRRTVNDKVDSGSFITKTIFHVAYAIKLFAVKRGLRTPIVDLVFKRTANILGGNVRLMISGGAPLSTETELFMNVAFKCKVGQGYGLTETCGMTTIVRPHDHNTAHVGAPLQCCEVRLVDYAEGGYTSKDKPYPRGEVVVAGHNITQGYMNDQKKTDESFKKEFGQVWFYTGDIGQVKEDGTLQIVDRKKDLVKLSHGEYIALGKIESALAKIPLVETCCVYADSYHANAIVIVVPVRKELAKVTGKGEHDKDLCDSEEAKKAVLAAIEKCGKEERLNKFEIPTKVILAKEPWTAESGMVTQALKLRRENIKKEFAEEIKAAYK